MYLTPNRMAPKATSSTAASARSSIPNSRRFQAAEGTRLDCANKASGTKSAQYFRPCARRTVKKETPPRLQARQETPAASIDHLVGTSEQCRRHVQSQLFRGLEVDGQFEFGGLVKRDLAGIGTAQYGVDVVRYPLVQLHQVERVGHQTAGFAQCEKLINGRKPA